MLVSIPMGLIAYFAMIFLGSPFSMVVSDHFSKIIWVRKKLGPLWIRIRKTKKKGEQRKIIQKNLFCKNLSSRPFFIHISENWWRPHLVEIIQYLNSYKKELNVHNSTTHGLRTPIEAFFHWNPELVGFGRQILGHLMYFRPNYHHPFWYSECIVHVFHCSTIISTKK